MKSLKKTAVIILLLAMFLSDAPFGFMINTVRNDANVVDVLWQAYQSGTLDNFMGPKRA